MHKYVISIFKHLSVQLRIVNCLIRLYMKKEFNVHICDCQGEEIYLLHISYTYNYLRLYVIIYVDIYILSFGLHT